MARRKKRRPPLWPLVLLVVALALFNADSFWRFLFPLPYQELITAAARREGLDPYLVAAVVRVESRFQPQARSARGAVGLMQLMPETAAWAAGQMGLAYRPEYLYRPDYNLRLGSWYLSHLLAEYGGDLVLALAAYNGGRGNVRQWLDQKRWSGRLAEIEDVPFGETRDFIRRVLRNYQVYRSIYDRHAGKGLGRRFFGGDNE